MALFRRVRTTLSIEHDVLRLLVVEGDAVTIWGSAPLPAGAVRDGHVEDVEAVGASVAALIQRYDPPTDDVYVSLPPGQSSTRLITLQPETDVDAESVQRMAAGFWTLDTSVVGWEEIRQNGRRKLFLLRVHREIIDDLVVALDIGGWQPAAVEPKPLALMRAAGVPRCIITDVERSTLTVTFADQSLPERVTTWPLTAPLLSSPENKVTRLADALADNTLQQWEHARDDRSGESIQVFCSGAHGSHPFLYSMLETVFGYTVTMPTIPFDVPDDMPMHQYMANIGLAQKREV